MAVTTGTNWTCYDSSTMTSREIYGRTLAELAKADPRVVAMTADLEKSTALNLFGKVFPERLFNVGIAEQNLFGAAAGMAKSGLIPFASTFAIFACMRAGEQIRTASMSGFFRHLGTYTSFPSRRAVRIRADRVWETEP